ncbi:hypothetical protein B0H13DRAFT_2393189 [Mycena leptocephala]|nr:hypothetical protein B0H13DRAFT_2393189 [Mycena leptocephala]
MSASNRKDRIVCAGVYKGPLNLSKEALRAKVEALIDSLLAVPIAQKNYLNWEINVQNGLLDEHLNAMGLAEAPAGIWGRQNTEAKFAEILGDPEYSTVVREAEDLELISIFSANIVAKIDSTPTTKNKNRVRILATTKPRPNYRAISTVKPKASWTDSSRSRPPTGDSRDYLAAKHKHGGHLRATGLPEPEPVLVVVFEANTQEVIIEVRPAFMYT